MIDTMSETPKPEAPLTLDEMSVLLDFQATVRTSQKTPQEQERDSIEMAFHRHLHLQRMIQNLNLNPNSDTPKPLG